MQQENSASSNGQAQHISIQKTPTTVSFIPLSGIGDVTRNLYLYEYGDEILIVDCGLGFPDETMLGVDLLLPDISYLLQTKKKIVGMCLTHGHEDHIGALPFILPQLPNDFPIYASPLTTALANEKLQEFRINPRIQSVQFEDGVVRCGSFTIEFIHITHSVPDSANLFIKTPIGNFYHASDFKFDLTPANHQKTDYQKIAKTAEEGVLCLMSDCLGSERAGHTPSEEKLTQNFDRELEHTKGKFIVTTYSSNISRLNQAIQVAEQHGRKVCFIGRSLIKTKAIGQKLGYLRMKNTTEIPIEAVKNYKDSQLMLLVAGSQGQENSALTRIANGEHKEIKIHPDDVIVFSSDPIPGNEVAINSLIDTLSKRGAQVLYSDVSGDFHVSGHGSADDLMLMMALTKPKYLLPISGTFRHMVAYRHLAEKSNYARKKVFLIDNGQEMIFDAEKVRFGRKIKIKNIYVDEISGEEVEQFVLRDREKLAREGIVIIMAEVDSESGKIVDSPDIITRGFAPKDKETLQKLLVPTVKNALSSSNGRVTNWIHIRKTIEEVSNRSIFKKLHRRPLVLPVVIEV